MAGGHADAHAATSPDRTRTWKSGLPPTYVNTVTHWWDLSQLYGSTEERNRELRSGVDGKLAIDDGMLPNEDDPKLDGVTPWAIEVPDAGLADHVFEIRYASLSAGSHPSTPSGSRPSP